MSFSVPILILAWRRPDKLSKLLSQLKKARPRKLYISIDGPDKTDLCKRKVLESKAVVDDLIDWPCEVNKKYENFNLGCKKGVSKGISWLFNFENQGIILEEDCIPDVSFLNFAEKMLEKYKYENEIYTVTGDCFIKKPINNNLSYYYSKYPHCWGWATWKNRWEKFDGQIKFWPELKKSKKWKRLHPDFLERLYWNKIMNRVYKNEIDSWAYPWAATVWNSGGKIVTPMLNLVSNIGFETDGTHTKDIKSNLSNIPKYKLDFFIGPKLIKADFELDKECFYSTFLVISFKRIYEFFRNFLKNKIFIKFT